MLANKNAPYFNGIVEASCSDNKGGWFASGAFTEVNGIPRNGLVHIDSTFSVTNDFSSGYNYYLNLKTMTYRNDSLYFGGTFSSLQDKAIAYGALIPKIDSFKIYNFPVINGPVYTSVSDGIGGWYIGGDFSEVGDSSRLYFAHIDSMGLVTSFKLNVSDIIYSMDKSNSLLALGGKFSIIQGVNCKRAGIIDLNTLLPINWDPVIGTISSVVRKVKLVNDTLYVGGTFNYNNYSITRNNFAVFKINDTIPLNIIGNTSGTVYDLEVLDSIIYVGGFFSTVNSISHLNLFSINKYTNTVTNFMPSPNNGIYAVEILNNRLFVGGRFTDIASQPRNYYASFDLSNHTIENSTPQFNNWVRYLKADQNRLFISGDFDLCDAIQVGNTCSMNLLSGLLDDWNPFLDEPISTVSLYGNKAFIGGEFLSINNQVRRNIAGIKVSTERLTDLNFTMTGAVLDIDLYNNSLFLSGEFGTINGQPRRGIAEYSLSAHNLSSWNFLLNDDVRDILIDSNYLYLAGEFTTAQSLAIRYLTKYKLINSTLDTSFNLNISDKVFALAKCSTNNLIYYGGDFTTVNGVSQMYFSSFNPITNINVSASLPQTTLIRKLEIIGDTIAIFFYFSPQNQIAFYSINSNQFIEYVIDFNHPFVSTISKIKDKFFVGGIFRYIGGLNRRNLASINLNSVDYTDFHPLVDNTVYDLKISNNELFLGGSFNFINSTARSKIASFDLTNHQLNPLSFTFSNISGQSTIVRELLVDNNLLYVGGNFAYVNGMYRHGLFSYNLNSSSITNFALDTLVGFIIDIEKSSNILYFVGQFSNVNHVSRPSIASLNLSTGLLTGFNPAPFNSNQIVDEVFINNNEIIVNSSYVPQDLYLVYDPITSLPGAWHYGLNGHCYRIFEQGNKLFFTGDMLQTNYNYFLSIDKSTHLPEYSINFNLDAPTNYSFSNKIILYNNNIILGLNISPNVDNYYFFRSAISNNQLYINSLNNIYTCYGSTDTVNFDLIYSGVNQIYLSATSSNQAIVQNTNISFIANDMLIISGEPGVVGPSTITVVATDSLSLNETYTFTYYQTGTTINFPSLDTVCINEPPIALNSATPSGGIYSGVGTSNSIFSPSVAGSGTHEIIYTYSDLNTSCINSENSEIVVDFCTEIEEMKNTNFELFPNPFTNEFKILANDNSFYTFYIYTATGQLIYNGNLSKEQIVNSQNLSSGIYYLRILNKSIPVFEKVLIKN